MDNKEYKPLIRQETPTPGGGTPAAYGSDAIAETLRALEIPYLALNPGASFRGLEDSLVNHLGNTRPQILLALHEESAVAIAHGYAKVSEQMIGAVVHSNVGLMHASMAVYNAWCDRAPLLLLGATGPVDAARRRPWIDWIHTSRDQGALVRDYTKWDDQPASVPAAQESLLRAAQIANTAPRGPTYVCLDVTLQETRIEALPAAPDAARYRAPESAAPSAALVEQAAGILSAARAPLILAGRVSRSETAWRERLALAERLGAHVLTDLKAGAAFPTDHALHGGPPGIVAPAERSLQLLREADVVLSLDWIDLAGTFKHALGDQPIAAKVIQASPDAHSHRGWSMDYQGLPPCDLYCLCEPDALVSALVASPALRARAPSVTAAAAAAPARAADRPSTALSNESVARALNAALGDAPCCLLRVPLGWNGAWRHFRHPLDYVGLEGGAGVGSGPGMAVGGALALLGSERVPVALIGDGDFLMGVTALWTAARYRIPLLIVVCNNRSFFNDELHQERVARTRGRPVENRWIGQRIADPDIDLAAMARAQGTEAIGPITAVAQLQPALEKALASVRAGAACVVDVRVEPGYASEMSGAPPLPRRDI
jgi:thiamine pyrophosphate-dependent acetolactate synthase large subunit-like protein